MIDRPARLSLACDSLFSRSRKRSQNPSLVFSDRSPRDVPPWRDPNDVLSKRVYGASAGPDVTEVTEMPGAKVNQGAPGRPVAAS